jgi:hypothetical protein
MCEVYYGQGHACVSEIVFSYPLKNKIPHLILRHGVCTVKT